MKTKITMLFLFGFSSLSAEATCQDFSGKYQLAGSTTEVVLTVTQNACSTLSFSYFYPANGGTAVQSYVANGTKTETASDANQIVYQTSTFSGVEFVNTVQFYEIASKTSTSAVSTYHLDASGNFIGVDQYFDATGKLYSTGTREFDKVSASEINSI